ncbi:hypothetical protein LY78DRAFT_204894 [Colletotrichum sublineola]|nr:hypothetical protein LY78DRAFT_204894 [Colletotrichum sublineola]
MASLLLPFSPTYRRSWRRQGLSVSYCVCVCVCVSTRLVCACAFVVVYDVQPSPAERPTRQADDQYDMRRTRISGQFRKTKKRQSQATAKLAKLEVSTRALV